jgi:hypothetical protein
MSCLHITQLNPFKDRIKIYKDANKGKELMTVNFLEVHNLKVNQEYDDDHWSRTTW